MPPVALPTNITILDDIQRHRMQALLAVDELLEGLVRQLEKLNLLDNSYIIYTSDNGFHIGKNVLIRIVVLMCCGSSEIVEVIKVTVVGFLNR